MATTSSPTNESNQDEGRATTLQRTEMSPRSQEKEPTEPGVIVRTVYSGSPAADAGIQHGDRIVELNETKIKTIDDAIQALNNVTPETKVTVKLARDGKPMDFTLTAARLPGNVPAELPPAFETHAAANPETKATAGETTDLKLPEFPHTCRVYVPSSHSEGQPLGALLWLQSPGDTKPADVIRQWQSICDRDGLILILPTPKDADHWERPDLEYLDRLAERVIAQVQNRSAPPGRRRSRKYGLDCLAPRVRRPRQVPRHRHSRGATPATSESAAQRSGTASGCIMPQIPPNKDAAAPSHKA